MGILPETPGRPGWLAQHQRNVYSQNGEDGVIAEILGLLPVRNVWCVEFGAWDGRYLSNTRYLIEHSGYSGVLIEGDPKRYKHLQAEHAGTAHVTTINAYVGFTADKSLDVLLAETKVPVDFDFLSIDIDGNDYHTWAATARYRPKVVCIEFNTSIPLGVAFVQPPDPRLNQGTSLTSMIQLAARKHYELVCVIGGNAFFVDEQYFELFGISDNRPEVLWTDRSKITYLFFGYDGTAFLAGCQRLPWHGLPIQPRHVQRLPRLLRSYPDQYGVVRKCLYYLWYLLTDPFTFGSRMWRRLRNRGLSSG